MDEKEERTTQRQVRGRSYGEVYVRRRLTNSHEPTEPPGYKKETEVVVVRSAI